MLEIYIRMSYIKGKTKLVNVIRGTLTAEVCLVVCIFGCWIQEFPSIIIHGFLIVTIAGLFSCLEWEWRKRGVKDRLILTTCTIRMVIIDSVVGLYLHYVKLLPVHASADHSCTCTKLWQHMICTRTPVTNLQKKENTKRKEKKLNS